MTTTNDHAAEDRPADWDPPADLAADTAVTRLEKAPGWYVADLPGAWDFATPSGGVLMTIALRAMQAELSDAGLRPMSANALFMSPVPNGPVEVRVEVMRRGGAAAQLRAALSSTSSPGPGLEVSATFVRDRSGPDFTGRAVPDLPGPQDAAPAREAFGGFVPRFLRNYEVRLAEGPPFWLDTGWEAGPARSARWFRHLVAQRAATGLLDPLVIPPVVDTMPPALMAGLGPEAKFFYPSLDLTVHFLADTGAEWLLVRTSSARALSGFATADCEVWADGTDLIAYATQTMIVRSQVPELS